jgi:hypothetical protein
MVIMTDNNNMDNNVENQAGNTPSNAAPNTPDEMQQRIDRLGGEQAPEITPEEFARLQRQGSLHIDSRGRVRMNRRDDTDPGVSLRKRRAWYS